VVVDSHCARRSFNGVHELGHHVDSQRRESLAQHRDGLIRVEPRVTIEEESGRDAVRKSNENFGVRISTDYGRCHFEVIGNLAKLIDQAPVARVPTRQQGARNVEMDATTDLGLKFSRERLPGAQRLALQIEIGALTWSHFGVWSNHSGRGPRRASSRRRIEDGDVIATLCESPGRRQSDDSATDDDGRLC
jgi:hypothetical protein